MTRSPGPRAERPPADPPTATPILRRRRDGSLASVNRPAARLLGLAHESLTSAQLVRLGPERRGFADFLLLGTRRRLLLRTRRLRCSPKGLPADQEIWSVVAARPTGRTHARPAVPPHPLRSAR